MKKKFLLIMSIALCTACSKQEIVHSVDETSTDEFEIVDDQFFDARSLPKENMQRYNQLPVFYDFEPSRGCPVETPYLFVVQDNYSEAPIAVKLFSPTGKTYVISLTRSGNYQYRYLSLYSQGRWYWRYVYRLNSRPCEPQQDSYIKDNTATTVENETVSLMWPFSDRTCWVVTCGIGCGAHKKAYNEYFAQDWACATGTQGKSALSPLDGVVTKVGYDPTTYGNYVEIDQWVGNDLIRFRIAHLESVTVYEEQPVFAGKTLLGRLGSTGNSTGPHAHCSVFLIDGNTKQNIDFVFVDKCTVYK